eukprot:scaffold57263_cov59-Cyclotella_meneghiniana.AAC.2
MKTGKKCHKASKGSGLSKSVRATGPVVAAVAHYLKLADQEKLPLETYFSHHRHSVGSCDGDGAFNLVSLFVLNPTRITSANATFTDEAPELSVITTLCMRVHDNLRCAMIIPNDVLQTGMLILDEDIGRGKTMDEYFDAFINEMRNSTGSGFRNAPYVHCKKLVNDCLRRMKSMKKVLVGKEERTVVRLFGLESEDTTFHQQRVVLPPPAPAPDVESLWLTLNRPEYYLFLVSSDLRNLFGFGCDEKVINHDYLERSLDYILEDEYRRKRLPAMLNHAAHWHMLERKEEEVAAWLLWELQPLVQHAVGHPETVNATRNSVILQLMINKFFDGQAGELLLYTFPMMDLYGSGITNFIFYNQHLSLTGRLPPAFIVTASVAKAVSGANENTININENTSTNLERTMRKLKIRKASCAMCGATRCPSGTKLQVCSRCESVAYCCAEHQKIHWRSGGHKQQCTIE